MKDILLVVALLLSFQGLVQCQADDSTCNLEAARPCLQTREGQFTDYTSRLGGEAPPKDMCLSQVQADTTEECFKTHTQLCSSETATPIRQEWDDLNDNIVAACEKFCPKYTRIAGCKLMIDSDGIRDSKFETFCSTFNNSLQCANSNLKGCIYGEDLYLDIHPETYISYWTHICNSGCSNIDATVAVISECLQPLASVNQRVLTEICNGHKGFKKCIAESTVVCDEVLKLILFKHKAYNRLEYLCKPTTLAPKTTTAAIKTTPTPTTTTTIMDTTTTVKETTTVLKTTQASGDIWDSDALAAALPECLPLEELRIFTEMTESNVVKLLLLLKIDECLHMVYDRSQLHVFIETLPESFGQAYHQAKQQSYITAQRLVSRCHEDQQACNARLASDPCNSGPTIKTFSMLSTFLVALLADRWIM